MKQPLAWLNGTKAPFSSVGLPLWDMGVVAGASITEMARTYGGEPFRLEQHLQRLLTSCDFLGFRCPYTADQLHDVVREIASENYSQNQPSRDLGVVVFVTAGGNQTYLGAAGQSEPSVGVHSFLLPYKLWKPGADAGVRLKISKRVQLSANTLPVHLKTRNRLHWWLADQEVSRNDPGARALLLNDRGLITETSTAAFFAVTDNCILTPRLDVLSSMSRRIVQEAATALGLHFVEADLTPTMLTEFSECFVTSTPSGLMSVAEINDHQYPVYQKESVALKILDFWATLTGLNPRDQILDNA